MYGVRKRTLRYRHVGKPRKMKILLRQLLVEKKMSRKYANVKNVTIKVIRRTRDVAIVWVVIELRIVADVMFVQERRVVLQADKRKDASREFV